MRGVRDGGITCDERYAFDSVVHDVACVVRTDLIGIVGGTPPALHHETIDLASQAQSEYCLKPHECQAGQTDRSGSQPWMPLLVMTAIAVDDEPEAPSEALGLG